MATASDVLKVARGQIGYSRWTDPNKGTKYGRWYAQSHGSYFGENGVPYCAMFASWVFDQAGAKCSGMPGAYCPTMLAAGRKAGKAVSKGSAKPGDVVFFDWGGDGVSDHVGIVEVNNGSYLTTIEGNTDNGRVARKTRSLGTVIGVIRPDYTASSGAQPTQQKPSTPAQSGSSVVKQGQRYLQDNGFPVGSAGIDGIYGGDTKRASIKHVQYQMNQVLNTNLAIDGINGKNTKAGWRKCGNVSKGRGKTRCIKAVQVALLCHGYSVGSSGVDGVCGSDTDAAIKRFQRANGLSADGIVGPATFAKLF